MAVRDFFLSFLLVVISPCKAFIARRNYCFISSPFRNSVHVVPYLDFNRWISPTDTIHERQLRKFKAKLLYTGSSSSDDSNETETVMYSVQVIVGQAFLIPLAFIFAAVLRIPFDFPVLDNPDIILEGVVATIPLLAMTVSLDFLEKYSPDLQGVTKASLRSVFYLLGKSRKIFAAIMVSLLLSLAAGFGEEFLFRGVLFTQILSSLRNQSPMLPWLNAPWISGIHVDEWITIIFSSILFGAVHVITFSYATIATIAGIYFGYLQVSHDHSLSVPIIAHSLYDFVAILYAHLVVSNMTPKEQQDLLKED
jgi:membrane protease YdiL (CAAX protease family)